MRDDIRWKQRYNNFKKALSAINLSTKEYLKAPDNIINKLAVIQSFEVVFELSWKLLKDYLKEEGIALNLPKEIIKEAFSTNIIKNGEIWIRMLQDRNSTSHEYDEKKSDAIVENIATVYIKELILLDDFFKDKI